MLKATCKAYLKPQISNFLSRSHQIQFVLLLSTARSLCDLQQMMMCLSSLPLKKSSHLYKEATRFLLTCVLICSAITSTKTTLLKDRAWSPTCLLIPGLTFVHSNQFIKELILGVLSRQSCHYLQLWTHKNSYMCPEQSSPACHWLQQDYRHTLLFKKFPSVKAGFRIPTFFPLLISISTPHFSTVGEGALSEISKGTPASSPVCSRAPFITFFRRQFPSSPLASLAVDIKEHLVSQASFLICLKTNRGSFFSVRSLSWFSYCSTTWMQMQPCEYEPKKGTAASFRALGWLNPAALLHHLCIKSQT